MDFTGERRRKSKTFFAPRLRVCTSKKTLVFFGPLLLAPPLWCRALSWTPSKKGRKRRRRRKSNRRQTKKDWKQKMRTTREGSLPHDLQSKSLVLPRVHSTVYFGFAQIYWLKLGDQVQEPGTKLFSCKKRSSLIGTSLRLSLSHSL